jgi:fibroblast growth factor receptor 1
MKDIGYNDNIVNMLGCITVGNQNACLVLEYCPNRDLHQYVKAIKVDVQFSQSMEAKISHTKEFMLFAWQIAEGMRFLSSKGIIHRDLAARNILIDTERNAKISDFGLCLHVNTAYDSLSRRRGVVVCESGRLPIKWLAPESLKQREFSSKSDVWSFGITLFEMYSFGQVPFGKIDVRKLSDHLERGVRPERPDLCGEEMYDVMKKCWQMDPEERPTFQELLTLLTVLLERSTEGYGYLTLLKGNSECYTSISRLALAKSFRRARLTEELMVDPSTEPPKRRRASDTLENNGKSFAKRHSLFRPPSESTRKSLRHSSTTKKERPKVK